MTDATAPTPNVEKQLRTMRILWGVFLWNVVLFVLLVYVVGPTTEAPGDAASAGFPPLLAILFALALASVALSFVLKPRFFRKAVAEQKPAHVQTGVVLALTLCEVSALLGVLAMFLIGNRYAYLLFVFAAAGQLLHFPRREDLLAASYRQGVRA